RADKTLSRICAFSSALRVVSLRSPSLSSAARSPNRKARPVREASASVSSRGPNGRRPRGGRQTFHSRVTGVVYEIKSLGAGASRAPAPGLRSGAPRLRLGQPGLPREAPLLSSQAREGTVSLSRSRLGRLSGLVPVLFACDSARG